MSDELRAEVERLKAEAKLWEDRTKQGAEIVMGNVAEIERLRAENADLRRWKAMDKPMIAAMKVVSNDVQRLRAEFKRFMDICAEGTDRGRAMDLIEARDWKRAQHAVEGKYG